MKQKVGAAGRKEPPNLPKIKATMQDAIEKHLTEHYGSRRPPTNTATILALILELDRSHIPFPDRRVVAEYANCSVWGVDSAVNTSLSRGLIKKEVELAQGHNRVRENVVQLVFLKPTQLLRQIAGQTLKDRVA